MKRKGILAAVLMALLFRVFPLMAAEQETQPWFLENRIYATNNPAFGLAISTNFWSLDWHLGGYLPFDEADNPDGDLDAKLDYGVAKPFAITDELSMSLGIGALEADMYTDYGLDFEVTESVRLQAGYRFHFDDDFDNRNEYYLGFSWLLNPPEDEVVLIPTVEPVVPPEPETRTEIITETVLFGSGTSALKSIGTLDELVEKFSNANKVSVIITGHADSTGSQRLNERLTQQRADVVKEYLIQHGIEPNQIVALGMGTRHPIADNSTFEGRAKNRRVEIRIDATFIGINER
ncbi:OmpA family protein [Photobacterium makurazakiensis]|uniref:OmpA family protein n=1 Tax=Photobacterium makurazakiensis TaxID=2910234 RepID=UPI003D123319